MNKSSLTKSLLLAGLVAVGGIAQADTYDLPQQAGEMSTMTNGQPNLLTTNSPYGDSHVIVDTTVLGAAPATVVTTTTYPAIVTYSYPLPAPVVSNADTVVTQIHRPAVVSDTASAATFDVPTRAGEASTMTGGAPNMVTNNNVVLGSSSVYSTVTPPYLLY